MRDPFKYYRRLARVREFVDEHLDQQISREDAAGAAGLSATYFSTFFRDKVGKTFSEWLREYRVVRAQELLLGRNYSITEVCYRVGFRKLWTFERAFKDFAGQTPKEFKESAPRRHG